MIQTMGGGKKLPIIHSIYLLVAIGITVVSAGWIDPDTPKEAYKTKPRTVAERFRAIHMIPNETVSWEKNQHSHPQQNHHVVDSSSKKVNSTKVVNDNTPSVMPSNYPSEVPTATPSSGVEYELVMSDEFNSPGRTFEDGADAKWTALEKDDYTNAGLHYYSASHAKTNENGELVISTTNEDTEFLGYDEKLFAIKKMKKHFKSAMMQSWNKFCFTGGIVETEVQLPGKYNVPGLWPAFWLLGNLARHTYVASSTHVWPFSSNTCTERTKNSQRINSCNMFNHYGLKNYEGRGAAEIDVFEIQAGPWSRYTGPFFESNVGQPFMSSSFQVAPGKSKNRPADHRWPAPGQWYTGLTGGDFTNVNILFYGDYNHDPNDPSGDEPGTSERDYWSDAISYNRQLDQSHFTTTHKYRVEWELPDNSTGFEGYLRWFLDDEFVYEIDGRGLRDAGEGAEISTEPSYLIFNTAISKNWGFSQKCPDKCDCEFFDCKSKLFQKTCAFPPNFCDMMNNKDEPIEMKVNWVRVYQNKNDPKQKVGCSTPERPTSQYIKGHPEMYKKANDEKPLKQIKNGGGPCSPKAKGISAEACGGPMRGICTTSGCKCKEGFNGPACQSQAGFDDINWEPNVTLDVVSPSFGHSPALWYGLGFLFIFVAVGIYKRKSLDGYEPIK